MTFKAYECDRNLGSTGRVEIYLADTIEEAVEACRYTHALRCPTWVGPTGLVVYSGDKSYAVVPEEQHGRTILLASPTSVRH